MGKAKKYVVTEEGMLRCYPTPFIRSGELNSIKRILSRILKRFKKEG